VEPQTYEIRVGFCDLLFGGNLLRLTHPSISSPCKIRHERRRHPLASPDFALRPRRDGALSVLSLQRETRLLSPFQPARSSRPHPTQPGNTPTPLHFVSGRVFQTPIPQTPFGGFTSPPKRKHHSSPVGSDSPSRLPPPPPLKQPRLSTRPPSPSSNLVAASQRFRTTITKRERGNKSSHDPSRLLIKEILQSCTLDLL
jgi:hypothetical protein